LKEFAAKLSISNDTVDLFANFARSSPDRYNIHQALGSNHYYLSERKNDAMASINTFVSDNVLQFLGASDSAVVQYFITLGKPNQLYVLSPELA
jgi:hypothetical protein